MYERNYVKRRKKKIIAAVVGGVSTVVVATLCIISFLGRFVGTFTVNLDTGNVQLALFGTKEEADGNQNPSSYLRISDLAVFHEYTFSRFSRIGYDAIDNTATDYLAGAVYKKGTQEIECMNYFKYTFFVSNYGEIPASYIMDVKINESEPSADGRYLDDTIRVMIFENDSNDVAKHDYNVYAKRSQTEKQVDPETGEVTFKEAVSVTEANATPAYPFEGYAEEFESSAIVTSQLVKNFNPGASKRYTIVIWLEGEDPQSTNYQTAPTGAKIKLGVDINAYEN